MEGAADPAFDDTTPSLLQVSETRPSPVRTRRAFAGVLFCNASGGLQKFGPPSRALPLGLPVFEGLVSADGQTCLGTARVEEEQVLEASVLKTADLLVSERCGKSLVRYELTTARELRIGGSSTCATVTSNAPVPLANMVHIFTRPSAGSENLEIMVRHEHRAPIGSIEFPIDWLGAPGSEWESHTSENAGRVELRNSIAQRGQLLRIFGPVVAGEPVLISLRQRESAEAKVLDTAGGRGSLS